MDIASLKGIGAKRASYFEDVGVYTTSDLVRFLPTKYIDMRRVASVKEAQAGEYILLRGFATKPKVAFLRSNFSLATFKIECKEGSINAVCYNRPYISNTIRTDTEYLFFGIISEKKGLKIVNPIIDNAENPRKLSGILPVYKRVEGIPEALMKELIAQSLNVEQEDNFQLSFAKAYNQKSLLECYKAVHNPRSLDEAESARRTLGLLEAVQLIHAYRLLKECSIGERKRTYLSTTSHLTELESTLEFSLSASQKSALASILSDLTKPHTMNRMIAGDVGSGKTIVALFALFHAAQSGYQAALMSPTEVLARQHYKTAMRILGKKCRIGYYSSGLSRADKESVLFNIRNGHYDIIIGTHALFQPNVRYKNLSMVVTDEVHRFGVLQRNALESKGETDVLVMSATPLPRTLALIAYADLDVSYLSYPFERANNITTAFVPKHKQADMYNFLRNSQKQSYIICPRIYEGDDETVSAIGLYESLVKGALKGESVELLHGRMSDEEKQRVIARFSSGETKILVSTTVVEVGIDIKTAESIVIFGAERFGLCQLHQLRGRVGRDGSKGYCFLITDTENEDSLARLAVLKSCNDAFELAEKDLMMRGAGDLVGMRQSGFGNIFFEANNSILIAEAREIVEDINANNPILRTALTHRVYALYGDTIFKSTLN